MQMFGRKNLNNKLQFAISEEKVYAITNTIAFTNRTTCLNEEEKLYHILF